LPSKRGRPASNSGNHTVLISMGPSPFVIVVVSALVRPPLVRGQEVGPHQTECPTDKRPPVPAVPGENLKTRRAKDVQSRPRPRTRSHVPSLPSASNAFSVLYTPTVYGVWEFSVLRSWGKEDGVTASGASGPPQVRCRAAQLWLSPVLQDAAHFQLV